MHIHIHTRKYLYIRYELNKNWPGVRPIPLITEWTERLHRRLFCFKPVKPSRPIRFNGRQKFLSPPDYLPTLMYYYCGTEMVIEVPPEFSSLSSPATFDENYITPTVDYCFSQYADRFSSKRGQEERNSGLLQLFVRRCWSKTTEIVEIMFVDILVYVVC